MDICRACMAENDENKMIFMFEGTNKLAEVFSKCLSLEANEVDELPAYICPNCHEMLIEYNKFRLKCLASDTHFRQKILSPIKLECSLPCDEDASNTSTKTITRDTRAHITVEPDIHINQHNNAAVKSENNEQDPMEMLSDTDDTNCDGRSIEDDDDEDFENGENDDQDDEDETDDNKPEIVKKINKKKEIKSTQRKRKSKSPKTDPEQKKNNIICEICGKKFLKQNRLEEHLRQHQGLKACVCKVCGKEFVKARNLVMHMRRFHEDERFKTTFSCDEEGCGKSYNLKETLFAHKRRMHSTNPVKPQTKRFVCDACGKLFKTNAALTKHSYTHTGLMPFMCKLCPKKFATKDKLKEHTMRHEGVKNHICLICGVGKTTSYELKAHMNYHTREKLFPCNLCTSVFYSNRNMRRHIRVVHCGKIESVKSNVSNSAEKPHECTECGKRFSHLIVFQTHMRKHTNVTL